MDPQKQIYLDYQATTPMDERVLRAMMPYMTDFHGNPHSLSHSAGIQSRKAVREAQKKIAASIGAQADDIVFTSGATESNNLAILGLETYLRENGKTHIISQVTEHGCILACLDVLEKRGFRITRLPVAHDGRININELEKSITPDTGLVSIMAVNNEIGTIQPIQDIGEILQGRGILFHSDAAQALGRIPLSVETLTADLLSLSAHKAYGPKGIGALYISPRARKVIHPLIYGGGQQDNIRSGTLPTPLCVGFGEAAFLAENEREQDWGHAVGLQNTLLEGLRKHGLSFTINGTMDYRIPHNLNLSFDRVKNEDLIESMPHICISSGSACSTGKTSGSLVIKSLKVSSNIVDGAVRISYGRMTKIAEIRQFYEDVAHVIKSLPI